MESSPLGHPRTPDRVSSEPLTPPPRNSMEDADSSVKRKRPRLDSGDRAHRAMSADPSSAAAVLSTPELEQPSLSSNPEARDGAQPDHALAQEDSTTASAQQPLSGTPSKVTINVRDPSLANTSPQAIPVDLTEDPRNPAMLSRDQKEDAVTNMTSEPLAAFQRSSPSPIGSPEIEIAEPEYMDEQSGPTVWIRPSHQYADMESKQEAMLRTFPLDSYADTIVTGLHKMGDLLNRGRLTRDALRQPAFESNLASGNRLDEDTIARLAQWFEEYLRETEHAKTQWYELYTCIREFWEAVPVLVQTFMQRA